LAFVPLLFAADFVVVANMGVSAGALAKTDIQAIFLGTKTRWDDGMPVKIAVLEGGGASKAFLRNIVGKTPSQFENYWQKLVFAGKATAPKTFDDSSGVIKFVSGTSGAVGFVGEGQANGAVKTIIIRQESSR
jgi:ABC-type phosphate transport system substrate-binding protein